MVWHHQTMAQSLSSLHWASYKSICFSWVALQSVILPLVLDIRHFPETSVRFDHLERHLMFVSLLGRWRRPLPWGVKHFNTNHFIVHPFLPSVRSFVSLPPSICPSVRLSVYQSRSILSLRPPSTTISWPLRVHWNASASSCLTLSSFLLLRILPCLSPLFYFFFFFVFVFLVLLLS